VLSRTGSSIYESSDLQVTNYRRGLVARWDPSRRTFGVLDTTGKEILANQYAGVNMDDFGTVMGWIGSYGSTTFTILNMNDENRITLECNFLYPFDQNGLAVMQMRNGKYGALDRDGRTIVAPQYDYMAPYAEGLAVVRVGEKWGYVDTRGQTAIEPRFDYAWDFSEGMAVVRDGPHEGGKRGYIDRQGRYVIEPRFDWAYSFDSGMAQVAFGDFANGTFGYIDKAGSYLWEPSN